MAFGSRMGGISWTLDWSVTQATVSYTELQDCEGVPCRLGTRALSKCVWVQMWRQGFQIRVKFRLCWFRFIFGWLSGMSEFLATAVQGWTRLFHNHHPPSAPPPSPAGAVVACKTAGREGDGEQTGVCSPGEALTAALTGGMTFRFVWTRGQR